MSDQMNPTTGESREEVQATTPVEETAQEAEQETPQAAAEQETAQEAAEQEPVQEATEQEPVQEATQQEPAPEPGQASVQSPPPAPQSESAATPPSVVGSFDNEAAYDEDEDEYDGADADDDEDGLYVEGPAEYVQRERSGRGRRVGGDVRPDDVDYKNIALLSRFLDRRGRILSRRKTRVTAKVQRRIVKAIKRARHLALLPYTGEHTRVVRKRGR